MSFADKLQAERRKNGLTQEDLAEALGLQMGTGRRLAGGRKAPGSCGQVRCIAGLPDESCVTG